VNNKVNSVRESFLTPPRHLAKVRAMHSPLFTRSLLIFSLLFALLAVQAGSLAHGISHILTGPSRGSEQSLPHDKYCDQCAAYAQIGSAVGSNAIDFSGSENCAILIINKFSAHAADTFVAFAARAPPYSA
jgi:hypothetical protein